MRQFSQTRSEVLDFSYLGFLYTLKNRGFLSNHWVNSRKLKLCAPNRVPITVFFVSLCTLGDTFTLNLICQKKLSSSLPSLRGNRHPQKESSTLPPTSPLCIPPTQTRSCNVVAMRRKRAHYSDNIRHEYSKYSYISGSSILESSIQHPIRNNIQP